MKPELKTFKAQFAGQELTFETGQLALQAGGAVTVRLNGSMIFASATMSDEPREGIDFFPLSVDFEERMYAGGSIPGGFFRREGRPTENAILTARLTDRPLRPLFPKDMRNDVQVIMYAMSADPETPLDVIAINAASAAVLISDAPWEGPVAAVRIGLINGEFVVNPTYAQMEESELDLRVAGTKEALLMVEAGASEVDEETMGRALSYAHEIMQPLLDAQQMKSKRRYTTGLKTASEPSTTRPPRKKNWIPPSTPCASKCWKNWPVKTNPSTATCGTPLMRPTKKWSAAAFWNAGSAPMDAPPPRSARSGVM